MHAVKQSVCFEGTWVKTESALYGCTMLLASVALGLDIRELTKAQSPEDPLPKEDRKKREGIFQRAPKSRRSASPATRLLAVGEGASSTPSLPPSTTANLLSVPSLSTKCLLQTDGEDSFESSTHISCAPWAFYFILVFFLDPSTGLEFRALCGPQCFHMC